MKITTKMIFKCDSLDDYTSNEIHEMFGNDGLTPDEVVGLDVPDHDKLWWLLNSLTDRQLYLFAGENIGLNPAWLAAKDKDIAVQLKKCLEIIKREDMKKITGDDNKNNELKEIDLNFYGGAFEASLDVAKCMTKAMSIIVYGISIMTIGIILIAIWMVNG